jgi:hypothetical protein
VRRCVSSRNLVNDEALAHWGVVAPKTTICNKYFIVYSVVSLYNEMADFCLISLRLNQHVAALLNRIPSDDKQLSRLCFLLKV